MQGTTDFTLTFDQLEEIFREGWRAGSSFDGDFSDELGALEAENEAWEESEARRALFEKEAVGESLGASRIRRKLLAEFGCGAAAPEGCICGHGTNEHRNGGLCEACMPVGDSTGRYSACQLFTLPKDPDAALKERLHAALDRICPEEG